MSDSESTKEKPDLTRLRAEIQLTRAELGETVQALAAKADVKARAREQLDQTKERALVQLDQTKEKVRLATADAGQRVRANPMPLALVAAGVAAVVGVILIIRGRRS